MATRCSNVQNARREWYADVTISSGKVWFSLIHPLVLRQELDTIITVSTESDGVPTKIQGRAVVTTASEWKPEL